jgi:hypothetical protein
MSNRNIVIALTLATAVIHIALLNPLMVLNGVGYLVLLAALYWVPQTAAYRPQLRYALIIYTAVTILGYFAINGDFTSVVGMGTKAIELALIVFLWREIQGAK